MHNELYQKHAKMHIHHEKKGFFFLQIMESYSKVKITLDSDLFLQILIVA